MPHLREPFNTLALMCVCFDAPLIVTRPIGFTPIGTSCFHTLAFLGRTYSPRQILEEVGAATKFGENLADVDWLNGTLRIERGIVQQIVDDVKTDDSRRTLTISDDLLEVLKVWKQTSQFSASEDWMFASPVQIGRLPYSYTGVKQELQRAADAAGIGHLRSHAFRHTYRTWLDSVGTPVGVQQRLMRHADIRTTMNIYGDVVTPDMREASGKVAMLALNGR